MAQRTRYVVDTAALGARRSVDACRLVLSVTAADIATFETDIPWVAAAEWPGDVRRAAEFLSSLREPSRGEDALYRRTRDLSKDDDLVWEAFVTFAPYAYDASAWTADSQQVAELSDAAQSMVIALTPEQDVAVTHALGRAALVPLTKWRTGRR